MTVESKNGLAAVPPHPEEDQLTIPSPRRGEEEGEGRSPATLLAAWLGRLPYGQALDLQRSVHASRVAGHTADSLLLLEHPHVYTRGRRATGSDVLASADELRRLGVDVWDTDRGGQTTYHGPGQLVGYPILELKAAGLGPVTYVRTLEDVIIETAAALGVGAHRVEGQTGVWTAAGKLAAIGVRISYGVTMHGFALNVTTDLQYFDHIVPCGTPSMPASSIESESKRHPAVIEVGSIFAACFAASLGRELRRVDSAVLSA